MTKLATPACTFELKTKTLDVRCLIPLRETKPRVKQSVKYRRIAASIAEVGLVEPPVVVPNTESHGQYFLLDGHVRIEILKDSGVETAVCLIATDDEAFTYNKRVNRLAIIQEHKMILTAIRKGVPEERLARALNINISSIRKKTALLNGICSEAVDLLRDKHVPAAVFNELRRLKPLRQIEAAELMIAMNQYGANYAKSLVAATPADLLVERKKRPLGLTEDQVALMEAEATKLQREFKVVEQDYGTDHLDLVLAAGYVGRLLSSAAVVRYLAQRHPEILAEFQRITELQQAA